MEKDPRSRKDGLEGGDVGISDVDVDADVDVDDDDDDDDADVKMSMSIMAMTMTMMYKMMMMMTMTSSTVLANSKKSQRIKCHFSSPLLVDESVIDVGRYGEKKN